MARISIDRAELLRLRLVETFAPLIAARKYHPAVIGDIVSRAVESKRFTLGVEGSLIDGGTAGEARDFLDDLESSGAHAHLFQRERPVPGNDQRKTQDARLAAMSPLDRLRWINAQTAAKRGREEAHD